MRSTPSSSSSWTPPTTTVAIPAFLRLIEESATRPRPQRRAPPTSAAEGRGSGLSAPLNGSTPPPPQHRPLNPPRASDFVVFLLSALTLFTAAGGGIGGGTLFVPLLTVIGGFSATAAVALSNVTVFGGACANFLINVRRPYARSIRALPRTALLASGVQTPPPLIDWSLILMLEPATLIGALMGGYIHELLPTWLLLSLLSVLLVFLAWQLTRKGALTYAAETREKRRERAAAWGNSAGLDAPLLQDQEEEAEARTFDDTDDEQEAAVAAAKGGKKDARKGSPPPQLVIVAGDLGSSSAGGLTDDVGRSRHGGGGGNDQDAAVVAATTSPVTPRLRPPSPGLAHPGDATAPAPAPALQDQDEQEVERLLKRPAAVPLIKVAVIALLTAAMLAGDTLKTSLPCGSRAYVLASVAIVPLALVIMLAQRAILLRRAEAAADAHALLDRGLSSSSPTPPPPPAIWSPAAVRAALESHVRWTPRNSLLFPLVSTLAGVCASMFGIGGGVVKGPLMLALGVCPEVAAATSSTMIFFTSAGASIFYYNAGYVQQDYAAALLVTAFLFTALGQIASQRLVAALGRRSVIVFAMAGMMIAAAIVAIAQSFFATRAAVAGDWLWDWGSICPSSG